MKKISLILATFFVLALITAACTPAAPSTAPAEQVLLDKTVNVGAGGGAAEVSFNASSGQSIHITLTAANSGMQPYGNLQYPDGTAMDNPPLNTAVNGSNQAEFVANQTGQYSLTLFDGSNQGGQVSVKIVALK